MQKLTVSILQCVQNIFFFVIEENIFSYVQFVSWKRWNTSLTKKKQNNKQRKQGKIYIKGEQKGRGEMISSRKVEGKEKSFEENL